MADDITGIEGELRSNGINVEKLELDSTVKLTYMTSFPGEEVAHREMGRVLNTFIDMAEDDDWEPSRLEATVVRSPGDVQGTWYAEPEWFERLLSYRLSETEFSTRVLETLDADEPEPMEAGR